MTPYYDSGGIQIFLGDCREVLPTLGAVDVTLTDPPFEAEAHTLQRRHSRGAGGLVFEPLPFGPITANVRVEVASQIASLTRRWVLTFCQVEGAPLWRKVYEDAGLIYKRTCIWVKPDGMPQYSGDRPGMGYETFVVMHPPGRSRWNGGGRHGVFVYNKNAGGGRAHEHPTQKPGPLLRDLVQLFSNPGDLLLDPFMGSGTLLRAAKDMGRRAIGIEISEKYAEIAVKRLSQEVMAL